MADPPNYSGHNIIKFSILPGGPKKYYYDTKLKEKEFFKSQEISEKQSLGKCCKVRKKKSVKVAQEKRLFKIQYFVFCDPEHVKSISFKRVDCLGIKDLGWGINGGSRCT